jgi:16S rRNA (guanine527-N7)-methyltransferase
VRDPVTAPEDWRDALRRGLELLEVPEPGEAFRRLSAYLDELERWNPRFGLVKYADRRELVVKHVLDSLAGWTAVRDLAAGGSVLDVGSGAGFPGIPLACALPGLSFTLLERMERRASFLAACAVLLGLPRVAVRREDLAAAAGRFDAVTFRAVAPLGRFLRDLAAGGVAWAGIAAYKGRAARAREEVEEARREGALVLPAEVRAVAVPFLDEERCLVVIGGPPGAPPSSSAASA